VPIAVQGLIYVPEKILTAVCFPKAEVENKYPHMTLAISGGWKPVNSNTVLMKTCSESFK